MVRVYGRIVKQSSTSRPLLALNMAQTPQHDPQSYVSCAVLRKMGRTSSSDSPLCASCFIIPCVKKVQVQWTYSSTLTSTAMTQRKGDSLHPSLSPPVSVAVCWDPPPLCCTQNCLFTPSTLSITVSTQVGGRLRHLDLSMTLSGVWLHAFLSRAWDRSTLTLPAEWYYRLSPIEEPGNLKATVTRL